MPQINFENIEIKLSQKPGMRMSLKHEASVRARFYALQFPNINTI